MELLQGLDLGAGFTVVVASALCCVVGIAVMFFMQFISGIFGFVLGFLEIGLEIFAGGPIAWCGCFVVLGICGGCGALIFSIISVIPSCGTPNAVNLCRLIGF